MADSSNQIQWLSAVAKMSDLITVFSSRLFSLDHYRRSTGLSFSSRLHAVAHFVTVGGAFDPHPLFSVRHYNLQSDASREIHNALVDYLRRGADKRLQPHPLFDPAWYDVRYPHPRLAKRRDLLQDYLTIGWREGKKPHPLFDTQWYLETYPDVAADPGTNPLIHFVTQGGRSRERRQPNPFFDTDWYLRRYPDVDAAGHNALEHYVTDGASEGRDPSAFFQTEWYRNAYSDVRALGYNPLAHYVEHGHAEGRLTVRPEAPCQLDADYSLGAEAFMNWRQRRLAMMMQSTRQRERLATRLQIEVVIFSRNTDEAPFEVSRSSFTSAGNEGGVRVSVRQWSEISSFHSSLGESIVLFVKDDDRIDADGLATLCLAFDHSTQICLFDSYWIRDGRAYPILQPGVNPSYLRAVDSTFSRFALRSTLVERLMREDKADAPRNLLLRALDAVAYPDDPRAIIHCASPLLRTPDLADDIRAGHTALIERPSTPLPTTQEGAVSVVICTKDKGHLVDQLVRSLVSNPAVTDVAVVSNQTSNDFAKNVLKHWGTCSKVTVIGYDKPFNFSAQCNAGVALTRGRFILFLNDDIVPISESWLSELLEPFTDPTVGAVGPLLLYPNEMVQHAGMFMGYRGAAGHTLRHAILPEGDYCYMGMAEREVTCVTGAALLVRRGMFEDLNGFDIQLDTIFQDVDLCLRITNLGFKILYNPRSILMHMESVSILPTLDRPGVAEQRGRQHQYLLSRYGEARLTLDPFLNPSHGRQDETLRTMSA